MLKVKTSKYFTRSDGKTFIIIENTLEFKYKAKSKWIKPEIVCEI